MEIKNILVIGGSGFVGRHVAHALADRGHNLTVPTRHYERAKHLLVLPTADVVEANVHDERRLDRLVAGKDAVINLVGILRSRSGQPYGPDFAKAHVELPKKILAACARNGVPRLLHMSALQADPKGPSQYLRSKGEGEAAVLAARDTLGVTVFRPSVIFGPGDSFLNMFARLLRVFPLIPLACPNARFQPVFVEDVAAAMVHSLEAPESLGRAFDLCGPTVYTLRELVEYVGRVIGCPRPVIGLPDSLSYLQAFAMEFVPGGPMSRDNYYSMQVDSVCAAGCALPFGRAATALEAVAPEYLAQHTPRYRYYGYRVKARR